jgi:methyl-accepting chemotaxis protein
LVADTAKRLSDLSSLFSETASNTQDSSRLVINAADRAKTGGEVVNSAISSMGKIRQSSDEITGFTNVIDDIAFQTNLLALNAGVEAARAGEKGKGFAVVAQEVGNLATRASESAKQIKELVTQNAGTIQGGETEVSDTGRSLSEIIDMVQDVRQRIDDIDEASRSQAEALTQLGTTMGDIDQMTVQNAAMVEEATQTSAELQEKSQRLQASVALFKTTGSNAQRDHRSNLAA